MKKILIVAVLVMGSAVARFATLTGCGGAQAIETDVIDCAKAEGATIAAGFSVMDVVHDVEAAFKLYATGGLAAVGAKLLSAIETYGGDIVACAVDNWPGFDSGLGSGSAGSGSAVATSGSGSGSGSGSAAPVAPTAQPTASAATVAPEIALKSQLLGKYWPGKKIKHPSHKSKK